ncbi:MAG: hypothetical protein ACREJD_08280 [Phycisphaerales bacterium]
MTHSNRSLLVTIAGAAGLIAFLAPANGGIVTFGGSVVVADPPANIGLGKWSSDTNANLWFERQTTLASALHVDALNTGTVIQGAILGTPGNIAASSQVASYMLRTDTASTGGVLFAGFITFDRPILGVIFLKSTMEDSDAPLSRAGVSYNHNSDRGLEVHQNPLYDALSVSADRMRIDFSFDTFSGSDDVRIITAVPVPATGLVMAIGAPLAARRRRS